MPRFTAQARRLRGRRREGIFRPKMLFERRFSQFSLRLTPPSGRTYIAGAVKRGDSSVGAGIRHAVEKANSFARALGTRRWNISGGEPMLRNDFSEIFDYLTSKATAYSLNSNGILIRI